MSKLFRIRFRLVGLIVLALVLGAATYGFAASNSVPESGAGDGDGAVSGYTITNIDYTLQGSDPTYLAGVSFDIAPTSGASTPDTVEISLNSGTDWVSCSAGANTTCSLPSDTYDVLSVTNLRVVATE